jgi:hypothetical protein
MRTLGATFAASTRASPSVARRWSEEVAGEHEETDPVNPERLTQRAGRIQGAQTGEVYGRRAGLECEVG